MTVAAEHLVSVASGFVRDMARTQSVAERSGARLLTFTIETEVGLAEPSAVHEFTTALAEAVAAEEDLA